MGGNEIIASTSNPRVKWLRSLYQRAARQREKAFPIEGVRLVDDALLSGATLLLALYEPIQLQTTERGKILLARLLKEPLAFPVEPRVLETVADTVTPQGVVAATPIVSPQFKVPGQKFLALVLDGLQDPGNLGTILRSAEAAAVDAVWLTPATVDLYNPKVVRAAMGAHFRLNCYPQTALSEIKTALGSVPLVSTSAHEAQPYFVYDWLGPAALLVGNEAHGASPEAADFSAAVVTIPMPGHAESLNVAVATAIILFEALRQRAR